MSIRGPEESAAAIQALSDALGVPQQLLFQEGVDWRQRRDPGFQRSDPAGAERISGLDWVRSQAPAGFAENHPSLAAALGVGADLLADPLNFGATGFTRELGPKLASTLGAVRLPFGSLPGKTKAILERLGYEATPRRPVAPRPPGKVAAGATSELTPGKAARQEAAIQAAGVPGVGDTITYIDDAGRVRKMDVVDHNPRRGTYSGVDLTSGGQAITSADRVIEATVAGERRVFGAKPDRPVQSSVPQQAVWNPETGQMEVSVKPQPEPSLQPPPPATREASVAETLGVAPQEWKGAKPPARKPAPKPNKYEFAPPTVAAAPLPVGPGAWAYVLDDAGKKVAAGRVLDKTANGFRVKTAAGVSEVPAARLRVPTQEERVASMKAGEARMAKQPPAMAPRLKASAGAQEAPATRAEKPTSTAKPPPVTAAPVGSQLDEARASAEAINAARAARKVAPALKDTVTFAGGGGTVVEIKAGDAKPYKVRPYGSRDIREFSLDEVEKKGVTKVEEGAVSKGPGGILDNQKGAVGYDPRTGRLVDAPGVQGFYNGQNVKVDMGGASRKATIHNPDAGNGTALVEFFGPDGNLNGKQMRVPWGDLATDRGTIAHMATIQHSHGKLNRAIEEAARREEGSITPSYHRVRYVNQPARGVPDFLKILTATGLAGALGTYGVNKLSGMVSGVREGMRKKEEETARAAGEPTPRRTPAERRAQR